MAEDNVEGRQKLARVIMTSQRKRDPTGPASLLLHPANLPEHSLHARYRAGHCGCEDEGQSLSSSSEMSEEIREKQFTVEHHIKGGFLEEMTFEGSVGMFKVKMRVEKHFSG